MTTLGGNSGKPSAQEMRSRLEKEKELERKKKKFEDSILKPIVVQKKAPVGVDPKSIICEFFKLGMCDKGKKCKYSHDLEQQRKAPKIDVYTDPRSIEKQNDAMETWDQEKLQNVVNTKQTDENKNLKTEIVCKYFIEAIENKKYGWFWECPNGAEKCIYRHSLPPGFVLKSQLKKDEEDREEETIEDQIEEEKKNIKTRTPLTLETFLQWKKS